MSWLRRGRVSPGRKPVLVLGSGPSGLLAAAAAEDCGHEVIILSKGPKSTMYGAQYLHLGIPGVSDGLGETIAYVLKGSHADYRNKVYGPGYQGLVSTESMDPFHLGWNIRSAYDQLWSRFLDRIALGSDFDKKSINHLLDSDGDRSVIISSIPLYQICQGGHNFHSRYIWAKGDAPDRDHWAPHRAPPFHVVCNGEDVPSWYRSSNIFGYCTNEWPERSRPPVDGVSRVEKPIQTDCTCFEDRILRVGRYGTWTKAVYAHSAYFGIREFLQ